MRERAAGLALVCALGCRPDWDDRPWLVDGPRIVAVRAEPAEVAPGAEIALRAFVATPDGPADLDVVWAFCREPKRLAENNVVAPGCATTDLIPAGPPGIILETRIPDDACRMFGPETPPQDAHSTPRRPRDGDATGGYYQPIRATLGSRVAFASIRINCNLAGAPLAVAQEYRARRTRNANPRILALDQVGEGLAKVRWAGGAAEAYVAYDVVTHGLVERIEHLKVTWFSTGQLGIDFKDSEGASVAVTPGPGPRHLWSVVRDDRGGVDVAYAALP